MNNNLCLKWNNHSGAFLKSLNKIHGEKRFCDATIVCQGNQFPVHKFVLSTCSEFFEELFETLQSQHPYIVFKDIDTEEMELLLSYMYNGEVNVLQEKLPTLIKGAEALRLKGLAVPDDVPSHKESRKRRASNSTTGSQQSEEKISKHNISGANRRVNNSSNDVSSSIGTCHTSNNEVETIMTGLIKEEPLETSEFRDESNLDSANCASDLNTGDHLGTEALDMNFSSSEMGQVYLKQDLNISTEKAFKEEPWTDLSGTSWTSNLPPEDTDLPHDVSDGNSGLGTFSGSSSLAFLTEPPRQDLRKEDALDEVLTEVHQCPNCTYQNSSEADIKRHFLLHHPEESRPFVCTVCSKRFRRKHHLQSHWRFHTREKPFECPKCSKQFKYKTSLKYHMQKSNLCFSK